MDMANKLEIHYYLANDDHSMSALVRNKCETELLAIFKEVCATFDIDLPVATLAYREGGLKEIWKFLGENGVQIQTTIAIFMLVLTIAGIVLSRIPVSDTEQDQREKELAELSIEEKRLSRHSTGVRRGGAHRRGPRARQPLATQVGAAPSGVRRLKGVRPDGLYVVDVASGEDPELDAAQLALHELVREAEALATEYFANLPR